MAILRKWPIKFLCALSLVLAASLADGSILTNSASTTAKMQIVMCRKEADMDKLMARWGASPKFVYRKLHGFAAPLPDAMVQALKKDTNILSVEPDGIAVPYGQVIPSGLVRIGADHFPVAHINGTPKSLNVDVAVLDTGIDPHIDLNIYQSFSVFSDDTSDQIGHGTGVAGIIGAMDNGFGVVGVAPGVRLWNLQVIGPPPNNAWSLILQGMEFVYENADQISVANMSFGQLPGGTEPYNATRIAMQNMVSAGVVVVAAVGNSSVDIAGPDGIFGTDDDIQPAAIPEVMAVSAMDPTNDTIAAFSNFSQIARTNTPGNNFGAPAITNYVFSPGGAIDVAAPGVNILTTAPFVDVGGSNGWYAIGSGTSLAAPHVTGLVALYIAANGRATNAAGVYRIRQAIINASLPQPQWHPHGQPFDPVNNPTGDPDTNAEPLAIASEQWIPQPGITNFNRTSGNSLINFAAVPGYDYTVQSATNLTAPVAWADRNTISGSNFVTFASMTDTNTAGQAFYRIKRTPSP